MPALEAVDLAKIYRVYSSPRNRLLELLTGRKRHRPFAALDGVTFAAAKGESIGIIGDNGAGKSTLLKLIAGSLKPTRGKIQVEGRLAAILELGAGFHPAFTGRENLFFAGAIMGIGRQEMERRIDGILDFAELGDTIDRPVKTYSSGMYVRLAFSLATSVDADILIVDEALAVGDQHFQKKCIDRMSRFAEQGVTTLFCSHSMHHIHQFCDRALWFEQGRLVADGPADAVIDAYLAAQVDPDPSAEPAKVQPGANHFAQVEHLRIRGAGSRVHRGALLTLKMDYRVLHPRLFAYGLAVDRKDGVRILAESTLGAGLKAHPHDPGAYQVQISLDTGVLPAGSYEVHLGLLDETLLHIDDFRTVSLQVIDVPQNRLPAMARAQVHWEQGQPVPNQPA